VTGRTRYCSSPQSADAACRHLPSRFHTDPVLVGRVPAGRRELVEVPREARAVVNYEQAVEPFLKTGRLADIERAMLMGGARARLLAGRRRWVNTPLVDLSG
jgi:hypothetical protein